MKALIMAAGQGERLLPFTTTRPKVMVAVAGKPILHHLLLEVKKAGVKEVVIVVRYLKDQIIDYFTKNNLGMKISFVDQPADNNGTASAILAAKGMFNEPFIALAGDSILDSSVIKDVIKAAKGPITIALKKVENPSSYGVAIVENGKVTGFEEKPQQPKSNLANISVYCLDPSVFDQIPKIPKSPRGDYEIVNLFIGASAVVVDGYWKDMGHPWDLLEANEYLLSKMESKFLKSQVKNSTITGNVILEKGAKIIDSYVEGNVYIGQDSVIGPNAYIRGSTSIGSNCHIGPGSSVKNSILFDSVNAKHLTYIGDSVIGQNVNFGAGTQIANYRFDGANVIVMTTKGWKDSATKKLGAFVGDNTKFGVLSCVMPGKLIGHNCWIHSGIVVNKNVPPDTDVFTRQPIEFAKRK
jgi:bifunctional UDP-N-acetylglucosamine pyrophosphorylase/glucosamine-1-phosphate N-acetyltransferase